MKYEDEYKRAIDKNDFVKLSLKKYPQLNKTTPLKRYYELRIKFGELPFKKPEIKKEELKKEEPKEEFIVKIEEKSDVITIKPNHLKILMIQDMNRFGIKITKDILKKYGFKEEEMNWVIANEKSI